MLEKLKQWATTSTPESFYEMEVAEKIGYKQAQIEVLQLISKFYNQ